MLSVRSVNVPVPVTFPDTVTAAAAGVSRAVGEFAISFCAGSFCKDIGKKISLSHFFLSFCHLKRPVSLFYGKAERN